jgi:hypothetical protein
MIRRIYRSIKWRSVALLDRLLSGYHSASVRLSNAVGVTEAKRTPELIVSLTTIPERVSRVSLCIDSLLRQSIKPDRIILWLSEQSLSGLPRISKSTLPRDLVKLERRGLEIRWTKDIGSYRKIIPTMVECPGAIIVTADDDIFYPRHWLKLLYQAYEREPQYVHCHRAHLIEYEESGLPRRYRDWRLLAPGIVGPSLDLVPTGVGGILYAPGHLHDDVLNESVFLRLCPRADDIWLKAMSLKKGVPCKKVAPETFRVVSIRFQQNRTLSSDNLDRDANDPQIMAVAEFCGVFLRRN